MLKQISGFLFFLLVTTNIQSQDIRGSEIKYSNPTNQTCTFEICLYVQSGMGIDRDTLMFENTIVPGISTQLSNDITLWKYSYQHAFSGNGTHQIYYPDSFRISSISNILNSETEIILPLVTLKINPYLGSNSSPSFMNKQTEISRSGNTIIHEPLAFDAEGDSLVFSLAPATSSNYTFPVGISIDSHTGKVELPYSSDIYAINIRVDEFRHGAYISSTNREMLIDGNALINTISENSSSVKIELFPNPVYEFLNVKTEADIADGFQIIDDLGRIVSSGKINGGEAQIDLSLIAQGVYFFIVSQQENICRVRFVKI